jgi:hypothetical protein
MSIKRKKKKGHLATLMDIDPLGKTIEEAGEGFKEVGIVSIKRGSDKESSTPDPSTHSITDLTTDTATHWQTGKHSDRHSDRHSDKPSDKHTDRHTNRHSHNSGFDDPFHWITEKQGNILTFLIDKQTWITSLNDISVATNIAYGTVRSSIRKLVIEKCIAKPQKYRRGNSQGISYSINEALCSQFKKHKYYRQSNRQSGRQSDGGMTHWQTHSMADSNRLEEEDINILLLNSDQIKHIYPKLHSTGFEQKHLKEIIDSWNFQKFTLDDLPDSLERAEWAVKHNDKIKDPLNYIYSSLMKGPFAKPAAFVSRAECEAQEKVKEAKRIQALNEEAETLEFENWWRGLSKGEQEAVDATAKVRFMANDGPAIRGHRMNCFKESDAYI